MHPCASCDFFSVEEMRREMKLLKLMNNVQHVLSYTHSHTRSFLGGLYTHILRHSVRAHQMQRNNERKNKKRNQEENNQYFRFSFVINPATKHKKKKKKNATTRNGSGETETSFRTLMESRTRSSKLFTYRLVLDSNRAEVSRSRRRMVRTVFRQYSEFLRTVKLQQLQRHA